MNVGAKLLGFAGTAGLVAALAAPALGQATTTPTTSNPPMQCTNGTTSTGATTATTNTTATPNTSNPRSTERSGNPCSTQGAPPAGNVNAPAGVPATSTDTTTNSNDTNALTNNPNGPNWLDKFNRPVTQTMPHHKSHRHPHSGQPQY